MLLGIKVLFRNYKDEILDGNFGIICDSGKPSYTDMPEVKEVEINGKFVANEGYDLAKSKETEIKSIEWQLVEKNKNKVAAKGLTIEADIDKEIVKLNDKKTEIETL